MSQIIVAQSIHGIILAVEKRAIQVNERGEEVSRGRWEELKSTTGPRF